MATRKLPPGFRYHGNRIQGNVKVNGVRYTATFPLDTTNGQLKTWQGELRLKAPPVSQRDGAPTLADDVQRYLRFFPEGSKRQKDEGHHLKHWTDALGDRPRLSIKASELRALIACWQGPDPENPLVPNSTINRWTTALRGLYTQLAKDDDGDTPNPAAKLKRLFVPKNKPRAVNDYKIVDDILALMPDHGRGERHGTRPTFSKAKTILTLIAYSGIPHKQIMRIVPSDDIVWSEPCAQLLSRPRRKGTGTTGEWIELCPEATEALRVIVAEKLFSFSPSSIRSSWLRALQKYRDRQREENIKRMQAGERPLPLIGHIRPYDLRHTFGSHALDASGGDIIGVQRLMGHSKPEQTAHYTKGAAFKRAHEVIKAFRKNRRALHTVNDDQAVNQ